MKFLSQFILFLAFILILSTFITAEMNVELKMEKVGEDFVVGDIGVIMEEGDIIGDGEGVKNKSLNGF
uniref:Uncharacterized protein n=1 Tax=Meloidogyne enterolobii TaxID=390850 RepID=A0A6V7V9P2_MELEN|nr:unnamed protein product [Meloidogyne enterolobii]